MKQLQTAGSFQVKNVLIEALLLIGLVCLLLFITGCAPRGETSTLDQIVQNAKKRYAKAIEQSDTSVQEPLSAIRVVLENIESAARHSNGDSPVQVEADSFHSLSLQLSKLSVRAGTTSRAAFGALTSQYESFAKAAKQGRAPESNTVLLQIARTYNLLGSELESTAFKL